MYDLEYFTDRYTVLMATVDILFSSHSNPVKTHHFSRQVRAVSFLLVDLRGRSLFLKCSLSMAHPP